VFVHRCGAILSHFDSAKNESWFPHAGVTGQMPICILNQANLFNYESALFVLRSNVGFGFFYISATDSRIARRQTSHARKNKATENTHDILPSIRLSFA
jgi:hypothetical protein